MNLARLLLFPVAALAPVTCLPATPAPQGPGCHDLSALPPIALEAIQQVPYTTGLCLRVDQGDQTLFEQAFGSYVLTQNVALRSACKPLSTAVLMSLVDEQLLDLDDTVSTYLPEYAAPSHAQITLRMCMSHTSGLPGNTLDLNNPSITLRQAAANIQQYPLLFSPGTMFSYGNCSMQVVGAVCEVVTGQTWHQLFQQRVAGPLGMLATDYVPNNPNPYIAGGAHSDLHDYSRLLAMLRAGGSFAGQTVLSEAAVTEMLTDHTSWLPVNFTPSPHNTPYGLGLWLDQRDAAGRTTHASSPGFLGFTGWIDLERDVGGVLLAQSNGQQMFPFFERAVAAVDRALLPLGVACHGAASPPCADGTWLNAAHWPRAGAVDFALRSDFAPANGVGLLCLGSAPAATPTALLDLDVWLQGPLLVTTALGSDVNGHALVPASLAVVPPGQAFALQAVWFDPAACGQYALRASHALLVTVQP